MEQLRWDPPPLAAVFRNAVERHIDACRAENPGREAVYAALATFGLVAVALLYRWEFTRVQKIAARIRPGQPHRQLQLVGEGGGR